MLDCADASQRGMGMTYSLVLARPDGKLGLALKPTSAECIAEIEERKQQAAAAPQPPTPPQPARNPAAASGGGTRHAGLNQQA